MPLPKGIWIPMPANAKATDYVLTFIRLAMCDRASVEPSRALFENMAASARIVDLEAMAEAESAFEAGAVYRRALEDIGKGVCRYCQHQHEAGCRENAARKAAKGGTP